MQFKSKQVPNHNPPTLYTSNTEDADLYRLLLYLLKRNSLPVVLDAEKNTLCADEIGKKNRKRKPLIL